MKKLIYLIVGARPNFMKIAPIIRALKEAHDRFDFSLIHTGQHYDHEMSGVFFEELEIPLPQHNLDCGSGSHAEQTAKIMVAFERICLNSKPQQTPNCVLVVGDVNSTLACSIVAKKLKIPVAHVEAGLRSGDRSMPEEINRLVTDSISDWLFCSEPSAVANLLREGHNPDSIFLVGQVMVDNLLYQKKKLEQQPDSNLSTTLHKNRLGRYGVVTLHRPSNVDDVHTLQKIINHLNSAAQQLPLVFSIHPRTREKLKSLSVQPCDRITVLNSLTYMEFLNLWKDAAVVITDSGGLQEETTALGVPCLTLRNNTERPITVEEGTNTLIDSHKESIFLAIQAILNGNSKRGKRPALWDGRSAHRIVAQLEACLDNT